MKMNKIAFFFAASALVMSMSGCKQNTEPRYEKASEFVLNTPALAQQYYTLTPDGTIDLTWSQPDWGFSAAAEYNVQISLNEAFQDENGFGAYYDLGTVQKSCNASLSCEEIATGICVLRGITDEDQYTEEPARPVYIRVVGSIPQVTGSDITSNVICLEKVKGYCAIQSPGKIYLVGAPEGWKGPDETQADHYAEWALRENADAIGSLVYYGTFEIPAGSAMFRFYTALTGWDADSYGSQADDAAIDYQFTNGEFLGNLVKGKGSFNFPAWEGGPMAMEVNMKTMKVTLKAQ